jgi:hypothetical protein
VQGFLFGRPLDLSDVHASAAALRKQEENRSSLESRRGGSPVTDGEDVPPLPVPLEANVEAALLPDAGESSTAAQEEDLADRSLEAAEASLHDEREGATHQSERTG